ncbi:pyroglutamyl-peptidase 1 [Thrips palmi]|uniref:Pyroglutamyl-peptidase 1 n=1 Tax=Thrips palmi TaxID=161013 RepID=A0A6P8ZQL5_THRPL|nr:pyroglutamyl-peptidase 1 [Thrips palmi]XP_034246065.1 pyroglutamyl-peptidase 1 [Thrips palmi]XP_034246066.1 pyroglutamyl-peptidase 1 [Thrips palmi]
MSANKNTVVVTGFGPFGQYKVNASWEAVKLIPSLLDETDINLIIEEIPVEYEETWTKISQLQKEHTPILMIHVGVSHKAKTLTLETCASKNGYSKPDVKGNMLPEQECCIGSEQRVFTKLAVERLAEDLNNLRLGVNFCTSNDAGLYLCEFSYYTSLCVNGQSSLFVHVPDIGKPYFPEQTAQGICEIIRLAVAQINENNCDNCKDVINNIIT